MSAGIPEIAVVDTHAVIWWITGEWRRFGRRSRVFLDEVEGGRAVACVPTVALTELSESAQAGRITLRAPFPDVVAHMEATPSRFQIVPLTASIVVRAHDLFDIPERGDRLIAATALSRSAWRSARWLVLAPHADDETLGTGALIADTAARNRLAGVMILTDGSGSHPCPTPADRSALIRRRRGEARHAVALLTGERRIVPRFLDWHDANPHRPGSAAFISMPSWRTSTSASTPGARP